MFEEVTTRRLEDAERFKNLNQEECMLCYAKGGDMRSFIVSALYNIGEIIREAIDLHDVEGSLKEKGWYLRTCKSCRGALLTALGKAADECREKQNWEVDSDGAIITREVKKCRVTGKLEEVR